MYGERIKKTDIIILNRVDVKSNSGLMPGSILTITLAECGIKNKKPFLRTLFCWPGPVYSCLRQRATGIMGQSKTFSFFLLFCPRLLFCVFVSFRFVMLGNYWNFISSINYLAQKRPINNPFQKYLIISQGTVSCELLVKAQVKSECITKLYEEIRAKLPLHCNSSLFKIKPSIDIRARP